MPIYALNTHSHLVFNRFAMSKYKQIHVAADFRGGYGHVTIDTGMTVNYA